MLFRSVRSALGGPFDAHPHTALPPTAALFESGEAFTPPRHRFIKRIPEAEGFVNLFFCHAAGKRLLGTAMPEVARQNTALFPSGSRRAGKPYLPFHTRFSRSFPHWVVECVPRCPIRLRASPIAAPRSSFVRYRLKNPYFIRLFRDMFFFGGKSAFPDQNMLKYCQEFFTRIFHMFSASFPHGLKMFPHPFPWGF